MEVEPPTVKWTGFYLCVVLFAEARSELRECIGELPLRIIRYCESLAKLSGTKSRVSQTLDPLRYCFSVEVEHEMVVGSLDADARDRECPVSSPETLSGASGRFPSVADQCYPAHHETHFLLPLYCWGYSSGPA